MNMAQYCKEKGFTLDQFKQYKSNIELTAKTLFDYSKTIHKHNTGMYFPFTDIMPWNQNTITEQRDFIMMELRNLGMEFRTDDNILYYRA
jgi:hypothetical protein